VAKRPNPRPAKVTIQMTEALKLELLTEAWEEQRTLSDYIFGLLQRRGKWARSCGTAGGYELIAPLPASKRGQNE